VWSAPRRTTPGGQPVYFDLAIEMCLTLRMVFKQPLRQTQGLMLSISKLMGVDITVPHFTTMSRRGNGLSLPPKITSKSAPPCASGRGQYRIENLRLGGMAGENA
jgi:hypothetical protein